MGLNHYSYGSGSKCWCVMNLKTTGFNGWKHPSKIDIFPHTSMAVSWKWWYPIAGWFRRTHPIKIDDLRVLVQLRKPHWPHMSYLGYASQFPWNEKGWTCALPGMNHFCVCRSLYGGFLKWWYPDSWMVFSGKSPLETDDLGLRLFQETRISHSI